jgi:hypothetical protein
MFLIILSLLISQGQASPTFERGDFKAGLKGNLELQSRVAKNSSAARSSPLNENWTDGQFSMAHGNLNFKSQFKDSRVEVNWFFRHAQSSLYQENRKNVNLINFPNVLVSRDVFKLQYNRQDKDFRTDSILNSFYYELDGEDSSFLIGRMIINYGSGEFFNPINPFNQPLGLVNQTNIHQASDGMMASFYPSSQSKLNFYLLGDKNQEDYENQITRTLWIQGEYTLSEYLKATYVIGEDQRRNKGGGELRYEEKSYALYLQSLYTSNLINRKASENLFDLVLGFSRKMGERWKLSLETGYQERDRRISNLNALNFEDRLLPYEVFVAPGVMINLTDKWVSQTHIVYDPKSEFMFGKTRLSWNYSAYSALDLFASSPLTIKREQASLGQRLLTTDLGVGLRLMF